MKKRIMSVILVCVLVMSALVGCGNNESETKTSSATTTEKETEVAASEESVPEEKEREYVELVVYNYLNSAMQPGLEETIEAVNEYLKEKLNCTLDMHIYATRATYNETVSTIVSSGTYFDMVLSGADRVPFNTFASQNLFLPLEDYVDEYLPATKSQVPEASWDAFTLNDHLYAIPLYRDFATVWGFISNTTMLDDLGISFPEKYDTFTDLYDFFYEVKAARDAKQPELAKQPIVKHPSAGKLISASFFYEGLVTTNDLVVANIPGLTSFEGMGDGETVFCPYFTDEYRDLVKNVNKMVQDNILPYDLSAFDPDKVLQNSGALLGSFTQGTIFKDKDDYAPAYQCALELSENATLTLSGLQAGGYAISAESENVERCLEVIDLLATDEYLATILHYGPEGIGWTDEDNDGVIELTDLNKDSKNRYFYQWNGWNLGGLAVTKVPPKTPTNYAELLGDVINTATAGSNVGFIVDTEQIVNEIAACNNVVKEYHNVLAAGQNNDVDKLVDEFVAKLKASGMEKIVEEVQNQLNAWRQEKGLTVK